MYIENEKLITTTDIGNKDSPNFMKKGTKVKFLKVANPDCSDLSMSLVIVEYNGKPLAVKESDVRIRSLWRRMKAVAEINHGMFKTYPRLRRNHHNPIKKLWYLAYYYIADLITGKKVDGIEKVDWQ